jgi:hypothetical protein
LHCFRYTLVTSIICLELDPSTHMRRIRLPFQNRVWQPASVNGISSMKTIKISRSGEELLAIHPSSSSEESRGLPSRNGSMPERLSGLMARKSGLGSGSLEDFVPLQCPRSPDQVESAERWAEPGSLEDSMPFRCPSPPDQVGGALRPYGRLIRVVHRRWSPSS